MKALPSQARLRELLDYEPHTGALVWKQHPLRKDLVGRPAGSKNSYSLSVALEGSKYKVHRLIWMWMTGEDPGELEIDHVDHNPLNNCWTNLRLATRSENNRNVRGKSKQGLPKGVRRNLGRFQAQLKLAGKTLHLGTFDSPEEAHRAYMAAANDLHGEFATA